MAAIRDRQDTMAACGGVLVSVAGGWDSVMNVLAVMTLVATVGSCQTLVGESPTSEAALRVTNQVLPIITEGDAAFYGATQSQIDAARQKAAALHQWIKSLPNDEYKSELDRWTTVHERMYDEAETELRTHRKRDADNQRRAELNKKDRERDDLLKTLPQPPR